MPISIKRVHIYKGLGMGMVLLLGKKKQQCKTAVSN